MTPFAAALAALDTEGRYRLEERAAIHEFDGGAHWTEAERLALLELLREKDEKRCKQNQPKPNAAH